MAKKTHLKIRMVPENNPDSKFIYYAKKPTKGEKAKDKLKLSAVPSLPVSNLSVNALAELALLSIEALPAPLAKKLASILPLEGFNVANALTPYVEPLAISTKVSFVYPPNPKTRTIVNAPALRRYCFAVKGT